MADPIDLRYVSVLWASVEHAADIADCHATLFDKAWDQASVEALLTNPASTALIARAGHPHQTVGFILAQLAADEAEILSFGVGKPHQRHGVGRKLIDGLTRAAKRAEAKRLFLEVADDNIPALVLYSRMGFKEVGRRKAYYERAAGQKADALILALAL